MKYVTLPYAGLLTGVSIMLHNLGIDIDDMDIARRMEAPYLFLHENQRYLTGSSLYQPKWINLYLHSLGLHLTEQTIARSDVFSFLRGAATAMVRLHTSKEKYHPVVYAGYQDGLYHFLNIKRAESTEPDSFALTKPMLNRRLDDFVQVYLLEQITPSETDYTPLLFDSLKNLDRYCHDLLIILQLTITKHDLNKVYATHLRPLIQDAMPMAALIGDLTLAEELRFLQHDYKHIFTGNVDGTVALCERLPKSSLLNCIAWIKEDIIDRLYESGAIMDEHPS